MISGRDSDVCDTMRVDVAIIGGGSAGVAASISAARTGARVILIERENRRIQIIAISRHKTALLGPGARWVSIGKCFKVIPGRSIIL